MFTDPTPTNHEEEGKDVFDFINPDSLIVNDIAVMEPSLVNHDPGEVFQFMRKGYYALDSESTRAKVIFNSTINLKEGW